MAKSPYATKPTSLASPVPNAEAQSEFDSFLSSVNVPNAQVAKIEQPQQSEFDTLVQAAPQEDLSMEEPMSQLPAPTGMDSLREQFGEGLTRLKNSFAVTDRESVETLKGSGLFDDVRVGNAGDIEVKRRGRGGWEKFDRDKFELVGDVLDFARDAFEAGIENSARAFGAGVGTVLAPGPGTAGGASVAGASGAVLAKNLGDVVAEKILSIKADPDRNKVAENLTAAAFGGAFSFLGSKVARTAANKKTAAIEAKKTIEYATTQAQKAINAIDEVRNSGIKLDPRDGKFRLDPQQLAGAGNVPDLDVTAKELSRNQEFQNFRREQGKLISDAYDSITDSISATAGKSVDAASDLALTARDVRMAEGKLIGSFRKLADEKLANTSLQAPRTIQAAQEALQSLGGRVIKNANGVPSIQGVNVENVLREFPSLTPTQAKSLVSEVSDLSKQMAQNGGSMTVDQAEQLYKSLSAKIDRSINSANGKPYAMALIRMKNAIRDDWTDMMGTVLPESQQAAYAKSKGRYSNILDATDSLGKLVQGEDISKSALVDSLFAGKNSLKNARNVKTLIQETNPQLWNDLTSSYLMKLKTDHLDYATGKTNWNGMAKKWAQLGPEMRQEILDGSGFSSKAMTSLFEIGQRVQNADFAALPNESRRGIIRNVISVFGPTMASTKGDAATSLLEGIGKDQSMMVWLKDGGLEETLKKMPGLKPTQAQRLREWISDWTPKQLKKVPEMVPEPLKTMGKQLPKTMIRRGAEKQMSSLLGGGGEE